MKTRPKKEKMFVESRSSIDKLRVYKGLDTNESFSWNTLFFLNLWPLTTEWTNRVQSPEKEIWAWVTQKADCEITPRRVVLVILPAGPKGERGGGHLLLWAWRDATRPHLSIVNTVATTQQLPTTPHPYQGVCPLHKQCFPLTGSQ